MLSIVLSMLFLFQREKLSTLGGDGANGKFILKPIIYFQTWRIGNVSFYSFGYSLFIFGVNLERFCLLALMPNISMQVFSFLLWGTALISFPSHMLHRLDTYLRIDHELGIACT